MQLRKIVSAPNRFDEEILVTKPRSTTKPAYPALMASQVGAFDPDNPPAAFPSLPLNSPPRRSNTSAGVPDSGPQAKDSGMNAWLGPDRRSAYVWRDLQTISAPVDYSVFGSLPTPERKQARSPDLWISLPLSLQYHIYKQLSLSRSDRIISRILGLSEKHFKELQAAVALRDESPASVSDIWNSCANSNTVREDSTVGDIMDIDSDIFQQNLNTMVFAGKYEVAYESEIMRAKTFLESRNVPSTILGIWVPDCTGSEDSTEFFRHLPKEVAKLVGFNDITLGLFSGGYRWQGTSRHVQSSFLRTDDSNSTKTTKIPVSGQLADASKDQELRPLISGSTPKRGRHPLATVTLAMEPLSPPRKTLGGTHHRKESSRIGPQNDTQGHGDERMSGGTQLRNRSSIPGTRDRDSYHQDSEWQIDDSSQDESGSPTPRPRISTTTASQICNAAFLTLEIKKKDELANVFNGHPPTYKNPGSRETTSLCSFPQNDTVHRKVVTLKYTSDNFNLTCTNSTSLPIRSSKGDFAAVNQGISKELSPPQDTISSYGVLLPSVKRKASFADISTVPMKRGRLGSTGTHTPSAIRAEKIVQSIETEDTNFPANTNSQWLFGSHDEVMLAQPQQNSPAGRLSDRAPSFSPIPENEHLEDFQALLKAQHHSAIRDERNDVRIVDNTSG
ncbi:uncharacterized protein A1O9_05759 [Exophiala aquamarina CBS 119918]|uniref:Uncharacterized protein n=1 Tax=Exophiala aquamarina CBS 119918 TaxID=1182545 RepID=A0A072PF13_9EURO|nr:uncharacterized protein A1O9_05759 [Exophiala aquamarina CBS 119918]KEF57838.1 hypothetical protein A1O9_05759 [Exophiala aquamarina CBS 119918]